MDNPRPPHIPVLLAEVIEVLQPEHEESIVVDCTLGYGGHSRSLAGSLGPDGHLVGLDRDADALAWCRESMADLAPHVHLYHGSFSEVENALDEFGLHEADRVLFDCGFSSPQIDSAGRGFSFQKDGPLDMRMDQRNPLTAAAILNEWEEAELTRIFSKYGEERFSRRIAKAVVRRRETQPLETTQELADLIFGAIPPANRHAEGIHPATRVFQALRIVVNDELEELRSGIQGALRRLRPGGRVGVLSYHSLEHRIVKEEFREFCGQPNWAPGPEQYAPQIEPVGKLLNRKAIRPCAAELSMNPRSRSAQLRIVERLVTREAG